MKKMLKQMLTKFNDYATLLGTMEFCQNLTLPPGSSACSDSDKQLVTVIHKSSLNVN